MDYSSNNEKEVVINNEYDYSNAVPITENIKYLVQFLDKIYKHFIQLSDEDEKKNERLKYEFKEYKYQKHFSQEFQINVKNNSFGHVTYKSYETFAEALNNKKIEDLYSFEIVMDISFNRGKEGNKESHNNEFKISFEPYKIKFIRKSNFNDSEMDQIENNINELMKKFPTVNTIFCSK